ncbi:hypothetical protein [Riemerella anatipestifer]|uniref:hypothetical protein n=1 Tax=Riemerella anatipestifer TaxID=34085 RepID=UPI00137514AC|nr:hypothetical protein [Riemerella anatipestifer]
MKNKIILASLLVGSLAYGQIQLQNTPSTTIGDENPFLDASKFNNFDNNVGKGLYFPTTDLKTWEFKTNSINPGKFKNYFDGMIVYNTGEGTPTTEASKGGIRKNLTRGFYYFKNPNQTFPTGSVANGEWVKIGDSVSQDGQEWVYNPTNKRIELKRSGTAPFTNKVYYDENGGLKNLDFDSYESYDTETSQWDTKLSNIKGRSYNWKRSDNIDEFIDKYGQKQKTSSSELFLVDEQPFSGNILVNNKSFGIQTKKENMANYRFMTGLSGAAHHQGNGDATYLIGNSSWASISHGTSTGYIVGARAQVNNNAENVNRLMAFNGYVVVDPSAKSISNVSGIAVSNSYVSNSQARVNSQIGVYAGAALNTGANPTITSAYGFYCDGFNGQGTATIGKHYGLYVNNINRASENYAIYTNLGTVRFGDNVGIGVDAPTEKLEVAGRVKATSFAGTNGATLFPDYVFQKYYTGTSRLKADYNFKTLSQVEDFVKTNGHLPGYKSAAEIKKQGYIDLMATQLTNVEKIEELYLHLLEKDKEVKALKAKNEELETRLEQIEKLLK